MIILFEGQAERVHLLMAAPAFFFAGDAHSVAEGGLGLGGQFGVHGDGDVGHGVTEEALANPAAAGDGVVVHGVGVGNEPDGVCEDAEAVVRVHGGDGFEGVGGRGNLPWSNWDWRTYIGSAGLGKM